MTRDSGHLEVLGELKWHYEEAKKLLVLGWGTKYCIQCRMIVLVIVVTFLITLPVNKFTNTTIPNYFKFIQVPIIETKFGVLCTLTIF